jgi:outer membrane receptor for monomeric catechols
LLICIPAFAQQDSASLTGVVADPNGATVTAAQVTAINSITGRKLRTQTDSEGRYEFTGVAPGIYRVETTATGFTGAAKEVRVEATGSVTVDFQLRIEAVTESVTTRLESYTVTSGMAGTKTDALILDVPQSIQVIPQKLIEDQQPKTL